MITLMAFKRKWGVHFTTNHTAKMEGMISLSTSVIENAICRARAQVEGSICQKCYAANMMARRNQGFRDCFARNTRILTSVVIPVEEWPDLSAWKKARFEAFGDLNNATQVINYFNCCRANKKTRFVLMTKNPEFVDMAIAAGYAKPDNLIVIQSSAFIDKEEPKKYAFIDKVFTVYSKDYIRENGIEITCGGNNCLECGRCYTRRTADVVREKVK